MIEQKDLGTVIGNIVLEKQCSVSADSDGKKNGEAKKVNVRLNMSNVMLQDVFNAAVSHSVIKWQNGQGRKIFGQLKPGQFIDVHFSHAGAKVETPEMQIQKSIALFRNMNEAERAEYIKKLEAASN